MWNRPTRAPAPAPVHVLRPDAAGQLVTCEVIEHPEVHKFGTKYEADNARMQFQLIAIQETGEEMFAGYAANRGRALDMKYEWLQDHPEHRDVLIERM